VQCAVRDRAICHCDFQLPFGYFMIVLDPVYVTRLLHVILIRSGRMGSLLRQSNTGASHAKNLPR